MLLSEALDQQTTEEVITLQATLQQNLNATTCPDKEMAVARSSFVFCVWT